MEMTTEPTPTDRSDDEHATIKAKVLDRIIRVAPVDQHQMAVEHAKQAVSVENQKIAEDFINELRSDNSFPMYSGGGGHRDVIQIPSGKLSELETLRDEYRGDLGPDYQTVTLTAAYDTYNKVEENLPEFGAITAEVDYEENVHYELTGPKDALKNFTDRLQELTNGELGN